MTFSDKDRPIILLALQSSLLGEVFPSLLTVDVSWDENCITLKFFTDLPLHACDRESISAVEAEMMAHFPEAEVISEIETGNLVSKLRGQVCVFQRK